MKRNTGYTLIELLVVVAMIALLVAILVPSLNKARELAKMTVCKSTVKQLGLAFHMYADDNGGSLPWCGWGMSYLHTYMLGDYVEAHLDDFPVCALHDARQTRGILELLELDYVDTLLYHKRDNPDMVLDVWWDVAKELKQLKAQGII